MWADTDIRLIVKTTAEIVRMLLFVIIYLNTHGTIPPATDDISVDTADLKNINKCTSLHSGVNTDRNDNIFHYKNWTCQ